jgi:hypothetical protein
MAQNRNLRGAELSIFCEAHELAEAENEGGIDFRRGKTTVRSCSTPNSLDRIFVKHSIRGRQHHFFRHCLND